MALLGAQLVISMVVFSFLHKLTRYYSFGRWLLSNRLFHYLHPTDEELRKLAGIPSTSASSSKGTRNRRHNADNKNVANLKQESYTVPRNIDLVLETAPVQEIDLVHLKFYPEFQWLLDYSFCAIVVYALTEVYYALFVTSPELNMSILWMLLAAGFCLRNLISQFTVYLKTEEGGERIICVMSFVVFIIIAMAVLLIDEEKLEFGLQAGYANFSNAALIFLAQQGSSVGPMQFATFRIILVIICAIIGALLIFPGLRLAQMHLDALKYSKDSPITRALLYINFMLPLIFILLWIKPVGRDLICGKVWNAQELMEDSSFNMFRISILLVLCVFRILLLPTHLQAYLNLAYERIERMKKESGRIAGTEVQKIVARVHYYLCVIALQYIAPMLLLLFMTLLLKTLGDHAWVNLVGLEADEVSFIKPTPSAAIPIYNVTDDSISSVTSQFNWTLASLRNIFTSVWYNGLLSFMCWWICGAWFACTSIGAMYYTRFTD